MAATWFCVRRMAVIGNFGRAMGIYERDYEREHPYDDPGQGFNLGGERTLTTNLVIAMFAVYVVQLLTKPSVPAFPGDQGWFTNTLSLYADALLRPWRYFEFLTYGFLHDVDDLKHIAFNMFGFWMFGRPVEERYGKAEYLRFFLVSIVAAGLCWVLSEFVVNGGFVPRSLLGASGGVTAIVILFALSFPHQLVALFGIIPMPAWLMAVLFVGLDLMGAMGRTETTSVAYTAHLGGAAFAVFYFLSGVRFERWVPSGDWLKRMRPGPKLRVHVPDNDEDSTEREVDEILAKIQAHGQESLTRRERKILEEASRKYQQRRR